MSINFNYWNGFHSKQLEPYIHWRIAAYPPPVKNYPLF